MKEFFQRKWYNVKFCFERDENSKSYIYADSFALLTGLQLVVRI